MPGNVRTLIQSRREKARPGAGVGSAWAGARSARVPPFPRHHSHTCVCGGGCPRCEHLPGVRPESLVTSRRHSLEQIAARAAEAVLAGKRPAQTAGSSSRSRGPESASGSPLPEATRAFFESRFGEDFHNVRVHADERAAAAASALDAHAYTAGETIVFGAGRYAPDSEAGRRLLAHELAHVVQQRRLGGQRLVQCAAVEYVEQVPDTDQTAAQILGKFDQAVTSIEQSLASASGPQMPDLNDALARLKALRKDGKVAVWRMVTSPPVYATYHNTSGQIRLNFSYPDASISTNTLVHEAIHAVHAARFPGIAEAYGKGTTSGVPESNKALLLLVYKWKAWTEYWAYRRAAEFSGPQQLTNDPLAGHRVAIGNKEVQIAVANVRANGDPNFDPQTWQPTEADKQTALRFIGKPTPAPAKP